MPESKRFYITTTLPYVNAKPHVGFAMEIIRADVIARYKKLIGCNVFFNTGTDEHGAKLYEAAENEGIDVKDYVDKLAQDFRSLVPLLGISKDIHFIRTTDIGHIKGAQEIWKRCFDNGFIYKKNYKVKYCVGCELEKTDSELVDGKCELHPTRDIELIEEENYFFKFKEFEKSLLEYYKNNPGFVVPDFRFNEIKSFVERGLEDFSISRLKSKMPWGIPVPNDEDHVMYVWFDALTNYISTLGWPDENGDFKYWTEGETVQYCGKDNLRQQSAMWQAMLMAAKIKNTDRIIIDGFITSGGQKMSKSLGNVISPFDVIDMFREVTDYPEEVLRFVLLHDVSSFEDGDLTIEGIKASYQANLANGIGNLTNRTMKMVVTYLEEIDRVGINPGVGGIDFSKSLIVKEFRGYLDKFDIKKAVDVLVNYMNWVDKNIQEKEAYKVIKTDIVKGAGLVYEQRENLFFVSQMLECFMPRTSAKILECIKENKMPEKPLFNRLP